MAKSLKTLDNINFYIEVLAKADVASVAVMDGTKLLMGKRNDNGRWTLPGGHFDPGEDKHEAAARELFEEAGIKVEKKKLKFLCSKKIETYTGKKNTIHAFTVPGGGVRPTTKNDPDDEVEKWDWVETKHGLPKQIKDNLHSPKNVVLEGLGLLKANWRAEIVSYYLNADLFKALGHKYLRKYQHGGKWIYVYHEGTAHGRQIPEEAVKHIRSLAEEHNDPHARELIGSLQEHNAEKLKLLRDLADSGDQDAHGHLKTLGIDRKKEKLEEDLIPAQSQDRIDKPLDPRVKQAVKLGIGSGVAMVFSHLRGHTSSPYHQKLVSAGITEEKITAKVMEKNNIREMLKELHKQLKQVDAAHAGLPPSQNSEAREAGGYGNMAYNKVIKNLENYQDENGKPILPPGYHQVHKRGQELHGIKEHEERVEQEKRQREARERAELAEVHGSMAHGLNRFMTQPLPINKIREIHGVFTRMFGKNMRAEDWPYDFSAQGYKVEIQGVHTGSDGIDFQFRVTDREGNEVTREWKRSWSAPRAGGRSSGPSIYNSYLVVNPGARGTDQPIGMLINRAQQKLMKDHAPENGTIRVTAALDVGGYNWANQGFEYESQDEARRYRSEFKRFAQEHGTTLTDEELAHFTQPCHFAAFHNGKLYETSLRSSIKVSAKQLERGEIAPGIPLTDEEKRNKKTARMFVHLGKKFLLGSAFHGVIKAQNMNDSNEAYRFSQHYDQLKLKAWQKLSEGYKKAVKRAGGDTTTPQMVVGRNQEYQPRSRSGPAPAARAARRPRAFRNWDSERMTRWFDANSGNLSQASRRATRKLIRERLAEEQARRAPRDR